MFKSFNRKDDGAVAIEFALVAPVFFIVLFAIIELSYKTIIQTELDKLAFDFAMTMARESDATISKADYKNDIICARNSAPFLNCENILFGADAYNSNQRLYRLIDNVFVDSWNTGCAGSTVIVEMLYPVTHTLIPFASADVIQYDGKPHFRSRGLIRREPVLNGSGTLSGGRTC
ncbi:MAG: pilus assembly protein [Aquisalinus sp.]|nr:pilus assembly protein [Aquisalinus sp.]